MNSMEKTAMPPGTDAPSGGTPEDGCDLVAGQIVEEAFQRGRAELGRIFEWIALFMIRLEGGDRVELWTGAAEKMFGLPPARVRGRPLAACGIDWDRDRVEEGIRWVRTHGRKRRLEDLPYKDAGGRNRFLSLTIIPLEGGTAGPRGVEGVALIGYDVTARVILESDLAASRQQESLMHLAAGVARQLNTPIQFMGDNLRFLRDASAGLEKLYWKYKRLAAAARAGTVTREGLEEVERLEEELDAEALLEEVPGAVDQTLEGLERVSGIVRSLQRCFQEDEGRRGPVDLNEIVESTLTVTRHEWKNLARVEFVPGGPLPRLHGRSGELSRMLRHLVLNAAEAAAERPVEGDGKGTVTIRTRAAEDALEIEVSDTGPGVPEEFRSRIFDPFFTTKDPGRHLGQGLTAVRHLVEEKYGGTLDFRTRPGEGTVFTVRLPAADTASSKGDPLADPS